jgi:hypothetical protein
MSSRREVIIKLTKEQRNEVEENLDKEVTHIKISVVPGAVIFAEAFYLPEK